MATTKRTKTGTSKKFVIQVGRCQGKYATRYAFSADEESKASMYWRGINIGRGYKKRLLVDGKVKARVLPDAAYCPSPGRPQRRSFLGR